MPAVGSARRDWAGNRRRAHAPVDDASNVPAAGGQILLT